MQFFACSRFLLPSWSFTAVGHHLLLVTTSVPYASILPVWCSSCPVPADTYVSCRTDWNNHDVTSSEQTLDQPCLITEKGSEQLGERKREKCTRVFGTFCAYDCFNLFSLLARVGLDLIRSMIYYDHHLFAYSLFLFFPTVSYLCTRFLYLCRRFYMLNVRREIMCVY